MIESEKDGSSFTAYRSPPNSKADWHRWCIEDFLCARTLNAAFLLKLPMTDILTPPNGQFNIPKLIFSYRFFDLKTKDPSGCTHVTISMIDSTTPSVLYTEMGNFLRTYFL
mmetsp:Transcript_24052/g.36697  ORF Transcript_24052/g.36697 Transcript_24052/m.36697 type:complete len:111 (-) Transcript_24052:99-431(-)